nr:hypothetical protein Iba_chr01bCG3810 [Ipomoea batatas]
MVAVGAFPVRQRRHLPRTTQAGRRLWTSVSPPHDRQRRSAAFQCEGGSSSSSGVVAGSGEFRRQHGMLGGDVLLYFRRACERQRAPANEPCALPCLREDERWRASFSDVGSSSDISQLRRPSPASDVQQQRSRVTAVVAFGVTVLLRRRQHSDDKPLVASLSPVATGRSRATELADGPSSSASPFRKTTTERNRRHKPTPSLQLHRSEQFPSSPPFLNDGGLSNDRQGDKAAADEAECGGGFWLHRRQRQAALGGVELGRDRSALVTSSGEANNHRHPGIPRNVGDTVQLPWATKQRGGRSRVWWWFLAASTATTGSAGSVELGRDRSALVTSSGEGQQTTTESSRYFPRNVKEARHSAASMVNVAARQSQRRTQLATKPSPSDVLHSLRLGRRQGIARQKGATLVDGGKGACGCALAEHPSPLRRKGKQRQSRRATSTVCYAPFGRAAAVDVSGLPSSGR